MDPAIKKYLSELGKKGGKVGGLSKSVKKQEASRNNGKRPKKNKQGFTLLEIIIVIIIVGVLSSLALPRFFRTVEYSRSTEALVSLSSMRQSMERCYLQKSGTYTGCIMTNIGINNPGTSPNAHFSYTINNQSNTGYRLRALRNTRDKGINTHWIDLTQNNVTVTKSGFGAFKGIK